jgi:hypothetical protein
LDQVYEASTFKTIDHEGLDYLELILQVADVLSTDRFFVVYLVYKDHHGNSFLFGILKKPFYMIFYRLSGVVNKDSKVSNLKRPQDLSYKVSSPGVSRR